MAFIGGALSIEKELFEILLFVILLLAGLFLLTNFKTYNDNEESLRKIPLPLSLLIGGVLGFVSGVVGIGGGIFLSPILFLLRAAKTKVIITTASVFILINSLSGIVGQLTKNQVIEQLIKLLASADSCTDWWTNWKFFKYKKILPTKILALTTSALVLFVALRMFLKFLSTKKLCSIWGLLLNI